MERYAKRKTFNAFKIMKMNELKAYIESLEDRFRDLETQIWKTIRMEVDISTVDYEKYL